MIEVWLRAPGFIDMLIAQITDTHIKAGSKLAYRKVDTAAALAHCVEKVNAVTPAVDVVLVTGDLVDMGQPEEYRVLRTLLDELDAPCYVIPGNHDERHALRQAFAGDGYLAEHSPYLHYAIDRFPLRLVALDSTVPGKPGGMMCAERLEWLDRTLCAAKDRPTLLFMHHPPFLTGITHMDVQNCANAEAFGAVVERHPQVIRLLCGHVHRSVQTLWHGIVASIGPSHSHAVALDLVPDAPPAFAIEPPAFALHAWSEDTGVVSHIAFVGDYEGPYPFFDRQGRLID